MDPKQKAVTETPAPSPITALPSVIRPTIKRADIASLVLDQGRAVLVGEYRGQKTEKIPYLDKASGKATSFLKCVVNIECGPQSVPVPVEVRLPRELVEPEQVASFASKGQTVAVRLSALKSERGAVSASAESPECLLVVAE